MKLKSCFLSISFIVVAACSSDHTSPLVDNSENGSNNGGGSGRSQCTDRIGGSWSFGSTPYGCSMPAPATRNAHENFSSYALQPAAMNKDKDKEVERYVLTMNDFLVETAEDYLLRRNPETTQEEVDAWVLLTLTITHQESYWTHYRIGEDGRMRLLRGDSYHGYGMMQIDDRWHKDFISSGDVYDLKEHLVYALDLMYSIRKSVQKNPCSSGDDLDDHNRSIYSAYNGGIKSKCRWKNPSHRWARNDKGFFTKYQDRVWERYFAEVTPPPKEEVVTTEDPSRTPSDEETETPIIEAVDPKIEDQNDLNPEKNSEIEGEGNNE